MYGLAPIGYLSGAGLKVTESSWGGGRGVSQRDFNGSRRSREVPTSGGVGELCCRAARPVLSPLKKKKIFLFFSPTGWCGWGLERCALLYILSTPNPQSDLLTGRSSKLTSQLFGRGMFLNLKTRPISPPAYQKEEASSLEIQNLTPGVWCTKVQRVRLVGEPQQERD